MKSKVSWTSREWRLVAKYFIDNHISPDRYGFSGEVERAQKEVLPADRHRNVRGIPAKLKSELKAQMKLFELESLQKEEQAPGAIMHIPPPGTEALSTEDLLVELARRVARWLSRSEEQVEIGQQLQLMQTQFAKVDRGFHPAPKDKEPAKVHKPRILVCGPNGDTSRSLSSEFPHFDLRFVEYDANPAVVWERGGMVDQVLVITKFVKHSTVDAVKALNKKAVLVTSVREAREWLANLSSGEH